jgi:hypothetical protein
VDVSSQETTGDLRALQDLQTDDEGDRAWRAIKRREGCNIAFSNSVHERADRLRMRKQRALEYLLLDELSAQILAYLVP